MGSDVRILLKPTEVAEALGCGRTAAYELLNSGEVPIVRLGRSLRVALDDLNEWVERQKERPERSGPPW